MIALVPNDLLGGTLVELFRDLVMPSKTGNTIDFARLEGLSHQNIIYVNMLDSGQRALGLGV